MRCWISIHAPRTGSDADISAIGKDKYNISIHAPRTGSDLIGEDPGDIVTVKFQSTLPARGATMEKVVEKL